MIPICNFFSKRQSIGLRDCVHIPSPLHSLNIKIQIVVVICALCYFQRF